MSQSSTDTDTSSQFSSSPLLIKQTTTLNQPQNDGEVNKLIQLALQELTNNPNNLENRANIQALIPISVLLDEMRSDYSSTRTYCLENLDTIALALGPAKAKGLLGGFISNLLKDQDDGVEDVPEEMQVMITLLSTLPKLIKSIGGPKSGIVLIQPLVETLPDRQKDETKSIYLKAIDDIFIKMKQEADAQDLGEQYLEEKVQIFSVGNQLEQLAALQLISSLYYNVSQSLKEKWIAKYSQLMLMKDVKKKAIQMIPEMINKSALIEDIRPLLNIISNQSLSAPESLRGNFLLAMPAIYKKKEVIDQQTYRQMIQTFQEIIQTEKSHIQLNFLEVITEVLEHDSSMLYFQTYLKVLRLNETETKNKSCALLEKIMVLASRQNLDQVEVNTSILSRLSELIHDKSTNTKLLISDALLSLLKEEGNFSEMDRLQFLRLLMELIEISDGEYKFKFLQKLNSFDLILRMIRQSCKFASALEIYFKLVQAICSIQTQKNWRMRQQCCQFISKFVTDLSKYTLEERLLMLCNNCLKLSLSDRIYCVREEATKSLIQITLIAKNAKNGQYLVQQFLKEQQTVYESTNYLIRLGFILALKEMFVTIEFQENGLLHQLIVKSSKDPVPNVRLACIETIFYQYQYLDMLKKWIPLFKQILNTLIHDNDLDVQTAAVALLDIF